MNTNEKQYPNTSITIDVLIFTIENNILKVLLVRRANKPFEGEWAIPGGFVQSNESLEDAAKRILVDKAGVFDAYLEQLYTFGNPKRDPRGRIVTVSYFSLIPWENLKSPASDRVTENSWFEVSKVPKLAFDHNEILNYAIKRLQIKAGYSNIVYGLLPEQFRLSDLQKIYEIVLDKKLDKRNFRKKMVSLGFLKATGKKEVDGAHRPAMLYQFKRKEVVFFD